MFVFVCTHLKANYTSFFWQGSNPRWNIWPDTPVILKQWHHGHVVVCLDWSAVLTVIDVVSWALVLGFIRQHYYLHSAQYTHVPHKRPKRKHCIAQLTVKRIFFLWIHKLYPCVHFPRSPLWSDFFPPSTVILYYANSSHFHLTTALENPNPFFYHHYFCPNCTTKELQTPSTPYLTGTATVYQSHTL